MRGIHDEGVLLLGVQLQHHARQAAVGGSLPRRTEPRERLVAQVVDPLLGHGLRDIAERLQRPRAGEQQVAAHQVRQAEVGLVANEGVDALHRDIGLLRLDRLENGRKPVFRSRVERHCRRRYEQHERKGSQGEKDGAHQLPDRSCWICQRPSFFTITRVFVLVVLSTSER